MYQNSIDIYIYEYTARQTEVAERFLPGYHKKWTLLPGPCLVGSLPGPCLVGPCSQLQVWNVSCTTAMPLSAAQPESRLPRWRFQNFHTYLRVHYRVTSPCQTGRLYVHNLVFTNTHISIIITLKNKRKWEKVRGNANIPFLRKSPWWNQIITDTFKT